jgi:streptogramin lyase
VGTPSGVFRCQIPNHTFEWIPIINSPVDQPTSQSQYIQTIFVDNQNQVWAGTKEAGLFIFDPDLKQFTNTANITQKAACSASSSS